MSLTLRYIGFLVYGSVANVLLLLVVLLQSYIVMNISNWWWFLAFVIIGFSILFGIINLLDTIIKIPLIFLESHWSAKIVPVISSFICGYESIANIWNFDFTYTGLKVTLAIICTILSFLMFSKLFSLIITKKDI